MKKKNPRQLYQKLFFTYSILIIGIVCVLTVYFLVIVSKKIHSENEDLVRRQGEKAFTYLLDSARYMDFVVSDLYQSDDELNDLLSYLSLDSVDYQKYRLDTYSSQNQFIYRGFDRFVQKVMAGSHDMTSIRVISYSNGDITTYFPDGSSTRKIVNPSQIDQLASTGVWNEKELIFGREIRNPTTMEAPGYIIAVFDRDRLVQGHKLFPGGGLAVYLENGIPLYSTIPPKESGRLLSQWKEKGLNGSFGGPFYGQEVRDYTVISWMPEWKAGHVPGSLLFMILSSAVLLILLGIFFMGVYIKRLTNRLNRILTGMEEVTKGNLDIFIPTGDNKDEIDVITDHFNQMCLELDKYIEKSYQAEIDQKNAEMAALQSQINPHFLYNTLESIRMKAICNGDREVGRMLYGLAVLFRSQIKGADVINLAQELHYCKKYVELFEFRYQQKFHATVECREEYMQIPIIKFVIQPIIENYFEHGIRMEKEDNVLSVYVKEEGENMCLYVEDNGYGMEEDEIDNMNKELSENKNHDRNSIGLMNVNRRLKAAYGRQYGVSLKPSETGGLCVMLHFPRERRKEQ